VEGGIMGGYYGGYGFDPRDYYLDYKQMVEKNAEIGVALHNINDLIYKLRIPTEDLTLYNFNTRSQDVYRTPEGELIKSLPIRMVDSDLKDYSRWSGRYVRIEFISPMDSEICQGLKRYCNSVTPTLVLNGEVFDSIVSSMYEGVDCNRIKHTITYWLLEHDKREVEEGIIIKKRARKTNDSIVNVMYFNDMEVGFL
jgi:hypothetical protein